MTATDIDQRRSQRLLVVFAVLVALLAGALALTIVLLRGDPAPRATPPEQLKATSTDIPPPDISWAKTSGVDLPTSRTHGPRTVTAAAASGFSESELGAALAAVHILIRSSAAAGPRTFEPTITQQVAGANAAAMKLLVTQQYEQLRNEAGVAEGQPVAGDAEVLGYIVGGFRPAAATIQVFLGSPALTTRGQLLRFDVQLERRNDDWAVVAPPRGDWGASTTVLSEPPAGLISYGDKP